MLTADFEKAIDAWKGGVVIDEMVLGKGSQVKCVYGHGNHEYIKWDGFGRGFVCYSEEELPLDVPQDPRNEADEWERSLVYDLKFE